MAGRRNSEEARHGHGQQERFHQQQHHQQHQQQRRMTTADEGKSPEVGFGRRESQLSYGFKLPDGRYRPPETEEEWNAFYQEYVQSVLFPSWVELGLICAQVYVG